MIAKKETIKQALIALREQLAVYESGYRAFEQELKMLKRSEAISHQRLLIKQMEAKLEEAQGYDQFVAANKKVGG